MFNYPRSAATANRLIRKFGFKTNILHEQKGVFDPVEGEYSGSTEITTPAIVVITPPKKSANGTYSDEFKGEDGTVTLSECGYILISPLGLTFEPGDHDLVLVRGEKWRILGLSKLRFDGSTMVLLKGSVKRV